MMKKILAISSRPLALSVAMRPSLQGSCFGFALYCLLATEFPDHAVLQRYSEPVSCSLYLQSLYDQNRKNADAIIRLEGIDECQDVPFLVELKKTCFHTVAGAAKKARVDGVWEIQWLSNHLDLERSFILAFAIEGGDEGHSVYVCPGTEDLPAMICDTADLSLKEIFDPRQLQEKIAQRMIGFFVERHPDLSEGRMVVQVIRYEKTGV